MGNNDSIPNLANQMVMIDEKNEQHDWVNEDANNRLWQVTK